MPDAVTSTEPMLPMDGQLQERTDAKENRRLVALDVVRGFTVAVMIFVDDAGDALQEVDHAPWDGLTFADIVMPWFLFMVGNAMAFSLKKSTGGPARRAQLTKLLIRSLKLFMLGLVLQGGGMPRHTWESWGWNLSTLRWCGILQRIAFAYLIVGLTSVCVPLRPATGALPDLLRVYAWEWLVPAFFTSAYLILMLATPVPSWNVANTSTSRDKHIVGATIHCNGVQGDLGPACNAAGYYDRLLFGQHHMYQPGEKVRLPECSTCSPGSCWHPTNASQMPPPFCWAPFDPEGAVATLMSVTTTYIGLHFGRAVRVSRVQSEPDRSLLKLWGASTAVCAAVGFALIAAFPVNKQLWTPSYALLTAAMAGGALLVVHVLCGLLKLRAAIILLRPFQWMGMNALLVFVLAASGVFENLVNSVYLGSPEKCRKGECFANLTQWFWYLFAHGFHGSTQWDAHGCARVIYVLCKIAFWLAVCGALHLRRWYWKF